MATLESVVGEGKNGELTEAQRKKLEADRKLRKKYFLAIIDQQKAYIIYFLMQKKVLDFGLSPNGQNIIKFV